MSTHTAEHRRLTLPSPVPTALRIARAITIAQSASAMIVTVVAFGVAVVSGRSDADARRAGQPHDFEGLGVVLGVIFGVIFAVVAVTTGIAAIGLLRNRVWGLVFAGVTEAVLLALAVVAAGSPIAWVLVIAPAATVLIAVRRPQCRQWCRSGGLA